VAAEKAAPDKTSGKMGALHRIGQDTATDGVQEKAKYSLVKGEKGSHYSGDTKSSEEKSQQREGCPDLVQCPGRRWNEQPRGASNTTKTGMEW